MKKIDSYIGQNVLVNILIVLLILVGLFTFFSFIEEVDDIGKQRYGLWTAIRYVLLEIPQHIYDLLPTAILLGSLLGLGILANNNELTVIRAAGVSIGYIAIAVMKTSLILTLIAIVIGETIAPYSDQYARNMRAVAQSEHHQIAFNRHYGFWARDGNYFINIRTILPHGRFGGVTLYEFDNYHRLRSLIYAKIAFYQNEHWLLEQVEKNYIEGSRIVKESLPHASWEAVLNPELIKIVVIRPYKLSSIGLYKYIHYLKQNDQRSAKYELAFWTRVSYPLVSIVMILIAIPFIFGSMRSVSIGQRVLVGAFLGTGFYMLNQTVGHIALVYEINPIVSALFPPLGFLLAALILMQRRL